MENVKFKKEWLPSDLLEFLEAEGVTDKFIKNIKSGALNEGITEEYFEEDEEEFYIGYSFIWSDTEEGLEFWNNIDEKWKEYINGK